VVDGFGGETTSTMSRAQEVSLARLLRVYESKIASSSGRGGVPDANGTPSPRVARDGAPGSGTYDDGVVGADASSSRGAFDVARAEDADAEVFSDPATAALKRRQHVDAMRALLARVRTANPDAADAYAERVDAVHAWVKARGDGRVAQTKKALASGAEHLGGGERDDEGSSPAETDADATETAETVETAETMSRGTIVERSCRRKTYDRFRSLCAVSETVAPSRARARADGGSKLTLSDAGEASLRRHRLTQDALTDDLVGLAAKMRLNAGAMEKSLLESRKGLASLERDLDANVASTRVANRRQKKLRVAFQSAGCWTWLLLFAVGLVFSWVFVYVRVTSDKIKRIR
jgi:SNARE protein 1